MATLTRSFSHIGLPLTDLNATVKLYTGALGWYLMMPPTSISEDDRAIGMMCADVFSAY